MKTVVSVLAVLIVILVVVVAVLGADVAKTNKKANFHGPAAGDLASSLAVNEEGRTTSARFDDGGGGGAPRDLAAAQREAWYELTASGDGGAFDPSTGGDPGAEIAQYHSPAPGINYQDALVDSVADSRMRAQHNNWADEVAPKSQGAMTVDNMDEASAVSSYQGHGLYAFRFQAPTQHNPLFVTEQDAGSYKQHATKFSFGG